MVFHVFPDDLDEIEFGAIWRQIEKECLVVDEPAVQRVLVDAVVHALIVEHDHGGSAIVVPDQGIEKLNDVGAFDGASAGGVDKAVLTEVQCSNHVAPAMAVGLNAMRQATW